MTLVIDASVACKWFLHEPERPVARALLTRGDALLAPDIIVAEASNVAWRRHLTGTIPATHARRMVRGVLETLNRLWPGEDLAARALEIALELRHPVYDCFYLALAEEVDAPLVTADRRLVERVAGSEWAARVAPLNRFAAQ
jgi:predicted nucleic acid-binding protein